MYDPMLSSVVVSESDLLFLIQSPGWFVQQKINGERLIIELSEQKVLCYRRNSTQAIVPPNIIEDLLQLTGGFNYIFDGELVDETFCIFDVIASPATNHKTSALQRINFLIEMFDNKTFKHVKLVPTCFTDKNVFVLDMMKKGAEGVVFKRNDIAYCAGTRSTHSLKHKFYSTTSCIVTNKTGPESVTLGLYDSVTGEIFLAGSCKIPVDVIPLLEVGRSVIDIRYLYSTSNHKLVEAVFFRLRRNKYPFECTNEKIKTKGNL